MNKIITPESLAAARALDIRTIDPAQVANLEDIHMNPDLPPEARLYQMMEQMNGNPYFYQCDGIVVKTSFFGVRPLQDIVEDCMKTL